MGLLRRSDGRRSLSRRLSRLYSFCSNPALDGKFPASLAAISRGSYNGYWRVRSWVPGSAENGTSRHLPLEDPWRGYSPIGSDRPLCGGSRGERNGERRREMRRSSAKVGRVANEIE